MFKIKFKEDENIYNNLPTLNLNENVIICKFKEIDQNFEIEDENIKNFDDYEENNEDNNEYNDK